MVTLCCHGFHVRTITKSVSQLFGGGGALPYLANWVRAAEQGLVFMVLNLKVYYFTISVADLNLQIGRGAVIQPLR